jgi:hypothetical protein
LLIPDTLDAATFAPTRNMQRDDSGGGALRLDLRHFTGGGAEHFKLERLRFEPNWARSKVARAQLPDWGDYRLSVSDATSGALVYRTGFDSTVSAGAELSTGELSVRFPKPLHAVRAAVEKRRVGNQFVEMWNHRVDAGSQGLTNADATFPVRIDTLVANGEAGTKVDVAVLGDGYQEGEYGKFTRDAARAASYLFSVDPFRKRARDFNVRSVFAASVDSGVTDPYLGLRKNTVLRCAYQTGEAERTLAVRHGGALREIASAVPYDFLLVLANSRRYGGSAVFGGPAVVAIDSAAARYLVVHEFAHVIGGLVDEYYIPAAGGPAFVGNVEPWNPNVTISLENGKWDHLARDTARRATAWNKSEYDAHFSNYVKRYFALRAAHADEALVERLMYQAGERSRELLAKNGNARGIGWFEGANGYGKGAFRAEVDCIMFSLQTRYFCSACSAAIERMTDAHCA